MATCDNCGAHVTADYHRVFADNEGQIRQCPACSPRGAWNPSRID